ncbi:MAG: nucleoside deaminase [Mariprofundaceae bacterium]|nr:nucleoside deaminase [Mariprofundaceae bacterium]
MAPQHVTADILLRLPSWLERFMAEEQPSCHTAEERMQLAIRLARLNIEHRTGGPFGAAVFNMATGDLVSAGVNLVVRSSCSMAHAEMIAISSAQQKMGTFDLGAAGVPHFELVSSSEPCAMCFGALPWSGIRHLVCGARDEDARAIGFDEGPKHPHWIKELEKRGISVEIDVCRSRAIEVLRYYSSHEGLIYNARQG